MNAEVGLTVQLVSLSHKPWGVSRQREGDSIGQLNKRCQGEGDSIRQLNKRCQREGDSIGQLNKRCDMHKDTL